MKGKNDFSPSRWNNLAFTFEELQRSAASHLNFRISVKTKALSLVHLDPAHQALIDRILGLQKSGMNCRQIAAYLNDEGVSSWTGKRFYPELVFGILRKAKLKLIDQEKPQQAISKIFIGIKALVSEHY